MLRFELGLKRTHSEQMFALIRQYQELKGDKIVLKPEDILPAEDVEANDLHVLDCRFWA